MAKKQAALKPQQKGQTGPYARHQQLEFKLPYPFLLLCKLWQTTPRQVLLHFMEAIAQCQYNNPPNDAARQLLRQYTLEMGYGQQHYTKEDLLQMFKELDAISLLWPDAAPMKLIDTHSHWRNKYYTWWWKKWWRKNKRRMENGE